MKMSFNTLDFLKIIANQHNVINIYQQSGERMIVCVNK